MGLFNNYVTLKLTFFNTPSPPHHASSCHAWHKYPFYHLFLFFEAEKSQRYAPTHNTSTHVFKQLNQIARFKKKSKSRVRISILNEQPLREVLWAIASQFQALGMNLSLSSDNFTKLIFIFFDTGEHFNILIWRLVHFEA